jgi:uncharacterized protein YjiS (DUF1127 family)
MNHSNEQRGAHHSRRPPTSPSDLAKQFREWQRLHKQVRDLERLSNSGKAIEAGTSDNEGRRK